MPANPGPSQSGSAVLPSWAACLKRRCGCAPGTGCAIEQSHRADLLHHEHPEAWEVTDEERARWVGVDVRINNSNRPEHPWAGREGRVVGVWRGAGFAGVWHVMLDDGEQFGAFTEELDAL